MIKISDLRTREVVNVQDGRKLGVIKDLDLDVEKGRINALVLPGPNRFINIFTRREDIVVPWDRIVKIGRDVILVEVNPYSEIHRINE
ncbi:MAG: YlmC/YmxH family sporulation protein [Syntrophomonadales bacterium]|jgi:YlmC/YmxH family sporulation protein